MLAWLRLDGLRIELLLARETTAVAMDRLEEAAAAMRRAKEQAQADSAQAEAEAARLCARTLGKI